MSSLVLLLVVSLITWLTRALPFAIFANRELPQTVNYLGQVLPPAIMIILVCYCLRNVSFLQSPFALPELVATLVVVILQVTRKNMYLSIIAGTLVYMVLLRLLA